MLCSVPVASSLYVCKKSARIHNELQDSVLICCHCMLCVNPYSKFFVLPVGTIITSRIPMNRAKLELWQGQSRTQAECYWCLLGFWDELHRLITFFLSFYPSCPYSFTLSYNPGLWNKESLHLMLWTRWMLVGACVTSQNINNNVKGLCYCIIIGLTHLAVFFSGFDCRYV